MPLSAGMLSWDEPLGSLRCRAYVLVLQPRDTAAPPSELRGHSWHRVSCEAPCSHGPSPEPYDSKGAQHSCAQGGREPCATLSVPVQHDCPYRGSRRTVGTAGLEPHGAHCSGPWACLRSDASQQGWYPQDTLLLLTPTSGPWGAGGACPASRA